MKQELEQLLSQHDAFLVEGELNKNKLAELARQYNPELLNLLMSNEKISQHFFATLETGVLIFKKDVFLQFLNNKEFLPDSFTSYKTKIGLATGDKYLSENQEVVLNFPYKDCVLEGGQTKDDAKRQEIFFNETLAPTEINRLLDNKVLTNFKRYDETGEHEVEELSDSDNLIIKGNNLIALHSLKKRFVGKIDSIIIDPPYFFNKNKSDDSFSYNSNFKLSTWLTFMKNRLEVAKELLSENGFISIIIGIDGVNHLKLLADEVFDVSSDNKKFVGQITWRKTDNQPNIGDYANVIDFILIYRKNSDAKLKRLPLSNKAQKEYSYEDENGKYRRSNILDLTRGKYNYDIQTPEGTILSGPWMINKDEFNRLVSVDGIHWPSKGKQIPYGKMYLKDAIENGQITSDFWDGSYGTNQRSADEIKELFGDRVFTFAKPEKLIQNLISISSSKGDIVLDYHLGSGTTAAVAHKMNRQYIGIEQMDYIETVSVERLKKVIAGEQGGVSKDVNWSGGGSFVYAEIKNDAQDFKNSIFEATTTEELLELFEIAKKSSFLSYRIDPKKLKASEFEKLSLAEQKQILSEIIDNNNLYVNYSDIDDIDYGISAQDKKFNHAFYGKEQ
ncbi:DNA methyltransferase [Streptococcus infantis]|jgi:adenine specific DNA methyltransferase (mod) (fragment)|uniref:Adenine specific DNA methylase Mod n=1 Tax=Streptococcus infantis SPAR10 TaxID=1159208 RepID=J0YP47_9STRE|nr:site-specific DNA-methyltransferase [Streptococcus infantis]EJG89246.1 adenine specific DNA methylase Mod [Streptococcus infantis SPAR10]